LSFFGVLVLIGVIMFLKNQNQGKKKTTTYRTTTYETTRSSSTVDFSAYRAPAKPQPAQVHRPQPAAQTASASSKQKKEQPKGAVPLLVCAIAFLVIGLMYLLDFADAPSVSGILNALVFAGCGAGSFFARHQIKKRAARLAKYQAVMGKDDCKSVTELSKATGLSKDRVRKDIELLTQRGDFGDGAYFDIGLDSLVISEEAAEKERQIRQTEKEAKKSKADREANTTEYMRIFEDMREAASEIKDAEISDKMMRLTELTGKILAAAEENPEKEKDIRRFMSYYLPQTQKLMKSYATMERQGLATVNIASTKERIGDILDNLLTGYEQQLDRMFGSDAMDISSDIDVLETMLKQDGLTGDGSGIGMTMGGH